MYALLIITGDEFDELVCTVEDFDKGYRTSLIMGPGQYAIQDREDPGPDGFLREVEVAEDFSVRYRIPPTQNWHQWSK